MRCCVEDGQRVCELSDRDRRTLERAFELMEQGAFSMRDPLCDWAVGADAIEAVLKADADRVYPPAPEQPEQDEDPEDPDPEPLAMGEAA